MPVAAGRLPAAAEQIPDSIAVLEPLLARLPDFANARVDLARAYRRDGRAARAREEVRRVLADIPRHPPAWLAYGDVLVDLGQYADARVAFERAGLADPQRTLIETATAALVAGDVKTAEQIFRKILQEDASHVAALCGLAAVSLAADKAVDAERLLRHALDQSAHLPLAWRGLGQTFLALGRLNEAQQAARRLVKIEPENPQSWIVIGAVATRLMRQEEALEAYEQAARLKPEEARLRMSIGHIYKTLGRRNESEAAYKAVLTMDPALAEAYWSLADLKNYTFGDPEIAAMLELLGNDKIAQPQLAQLNFALGKALNSAAATPRHLNTMPGATHYGASMRRSISGTSNAARPAFARSSTRPSSPAVPAAAIRAPLRYSSWGCRAPDPPWWSRFSPAIRWSRARWSCPTSSTSRTNSTTWRRPGRLSGDGRHRLRSEFSPHSAPATSRNRAAAHRTPALHRQTAQQLQPTSDSSTRFCARDRHRRPPASMDCCFSTFKQHFAEGQTFSYDLEDLGRYYRCYLSLMDHWDAVLPGKVLHVQYEDMVRDRKRTSAASSTPAGCRSRKAASPFTGRAGRCALRAPSRCASPSTPRGGLLAAFRKGTSTAARGARRQPGALRAFAVIRRPRAGPSRRR